MTLTADEFMRRFLLHVLPGGFHRIRHFGLIANNGRKEKLALARQLLNVVPVPNIEETVTDTTLDEPTRPNFVCTHCGANDRPGIVRAWSGNSRTTFIAG